MGVNNARILISTAVSARTAAAAAVVCIEAMGECEYVTLILFTFFFFCPYCLIAFLFFSFLFFSSSSVVT